MYRPWRSPATWCLGGGLWGFAALADHWFRNRFLVAGFLFEKQLLVVEIGDYQDELLQRFRKENIQGVVFVGVMYALIVLQPSIVLTYVQKTYIQKILYNHPGKI